VPILLKQLNRFRQIFGPPDRTSRYLLTHILKENQRPIVEDLNNNRTIYVNSNDVVSAAAAAAAAAASGGKMTLPLCLICLFSSVNINTILKSVTIGKINTFI
jgi:nucleoside-diphosphate-sugar epimerase